MAFIHWAVLAGCKLNASWVVASGLAGQRACALLLRCFCIAFALHVHCICVAANRRNIEGVFAAYFRVGILASHSVTGSLGASCESWICHANAFVGWPFLIHALTSWQCGVCGGGFFQDAAQALGFV